VIAVCDAKSYFLSFFSGGLLAIALLKQLAPAFSCHGAFAEFPLPGLKLFAGELMVNPVTNFPTSKFLILFSP